MQTIIGVDVGGTLLRAARYDLDLNVLERVEQPTRADLGGEAVLERLYQVIRQVLPESPDTSIGIGVALPGPVDMDKGILIAPPNLPLKDTLIAHLVEQTMGGPVFIGNDADLAALAEHQRGAGRGTRNMIYITVSTGVGGGIIADDRIYTGRGQGGEIGHMVVWPDGPMCGCGKQGHLEAVSSGTGIARAARERLSAGEQSAMSGMVKENLSQVTAKLVGQAAANGDALALEIVTRAGRYLGIGIASLMMLFNPDMFVIGGGVSKLDKLLFDPMHKAVEEYAMHPRYWKDVPIVHAQLGDDVVLTGSAALVKTMTGNNPKTL
ncbi:MAG: ROK family protein [Anaerolineae bacterium]|nr:ROK family protein [Anaerolineae bacterium]